MRTTLAILGLMLLTVIVSGVTALTMLNIAPRAGATITTINGSDSIRNAPTTLNANFTSLNSAKIEVSTTTLPNLTTLLNLTSVGTITTGTWSATAIAVSKGGTGTTSPTSNLVMLGNGSSGLKGVNGLGSSGQFLTSGGAGVAPTWTSNTLDTTLSYNWTGNYFGVQNFYASSTTAHPIFFNGLQYTFPSTRAASDTVPMQDASGNFTFNPVTPPRYTLIDNTGITAATGAYATSTTGITIPGNTLTPNSTIVFRYSASACSSTGNLVIFLRASSGATLAQATVLSGTNNTFAGAGDGLIVATSTSFKGEVYQVNGIYGNANGAGNLAQVLSVSTGGTAYIDFTQNVTLNMVVQNNACSAGSTGLVNFSIVAQR